MPLDAAGIWFKAFKQLNEPTDIRVDIESCDQQIKSTLSYSHIDGDGSSVLFDLSKKFKLNLKNTAADKKTPEISLALYIKQILFFNYYSKKRSKNIWPFKIKKSNIMPTLQSHIHIDKNLLSELKLQLVKNQTTINSHLLMALDQTVRHFYKIKSETTTWMIPVNFRNELGIDLNDHSKSGNYVSNFNIDIQATDSTKSVQSQISQSLKHKKHWGTWFWQNISLYVPYSFILNITSKRFENNFCTGIFTNLGSWASTQKIEKLVIYANPIISNPIGASCIEVNNELHLGLRVYPTFPITQNELNQFSDFWKDLILSPK
jgi:hypothetical protein